jgi:peptide/nickel transport system substrate-binding protein
VYSVTSDPDAPINLRQGGWCPDWRSGSEWFPVFFQSESGGNGAYFSEPAVDSEIHRISLLPINEQPAAWGALDETIMTDYYPVVVAGYQGVAMLHGSRIGGMNADNVVAMPTWKDIYVVR